MGRRHRAQCRPQWQHSHLWTEKRRKKCEGFSLERFYLKLLQSGFALTKWPNQACMNTLSKEQVLVDSKLIFTPVMNTPVIKLKEMKIRYPMFPKCHPPLKPLFSSLFMRSEGWKAMFIGWRFPLHPTCGFPRRERDARGITIMSNKEKIRNIGHVRVTDISFTTTGHGRIFLYTLCHKDIPF